MRKRKRGTFERCCEQCAVGGAAVRAEKAERAIKGGKMERTGGRHPLAFFFRLSSPFLPQCAVPHSSRFSQWLMAAALCFASGGRQRPTGAPLLSAVARFAPSPFLFAPLSLSNSLFPSRLHLLSLACALKKDQVLDSALAASRLLCRLPSALC